MRTSISCGKLYLLCELCAGALRPLQLDFVRSLAENKILKRRGRKEKRAKGAENGYFMGFEMYGYFDQITRSRITVKIQEQ